MSKLHITDDGRILSCSADILECKYAKYETEASPRHFEIDQMDQAIKQREIFMADTHGHFPKTQRKAPLKARKKSQSSFDESHRSEEIWSSLANDRFARTPKPSDLTDKAEFSDFNESIILAQ